MSDSYPGVVSSCSCRRRRCRRVVGVPEEDGEEVEGESLNIRAEETGSENSLRRRLADDKPDL